MVFQIPVVGKEHLPSRPPDRAEWVVEEKVLQIPLVGKEYPITRTPRNDGVPLGPRPTSSLTPTRTRVQEDMPRGEQSVVGDA